MSKRLSKKDELEAIQGIVVFLIPFLIGFFGLIWWGFTWSIHVFTGSVLSLLISWWGYRKIDSYSTKQELEK